MLAMDAGLGIVFVRVGWLLVLYADGVSRERRKGTE
jgi:hypothetical protein